MKKIFLNLFIILFSFSNLCFAVSWETVPINKKYYKDEFKKPYWHLGESLLYGGAYYLNIEEYNTYPKYIFAVRLILEKRYYEFAPMLKLR